MSLTTSQKSFESFDQLINKIRKSSEATRNKGTLFEYMTKVYLEQSYPEKFANVWMLKDVPSWTGISHQDLGVDLVCQDEADPSKFIAVQDKFYEEDHVVSKSDVDSFVAELGKSVYSAGIWIATNDRWNRNAEKMLIHTSKTITRVGLSELRHADINWAKFDATHLPHNEHINLKKSHKHLRPYQKDAVKHALKYYRKYYQEGKNSYRRGKLIMAPGTGKTYTSLRIAEALQKDEHKKDFYVLYLVPSIQLLSQTLFSWYRDCNTNMVKFAVTSDRNATKASRAGSGDISAIDIGFPATTDAEKLEHNYDTYVTHHKNNDKRMFVIFSTYQSIDVIHDAQKKGFPDFNLIICDEAHRTAGNYTSRHDEGFFTKVLHDDYIHSQLRLFQTATPKIYGDKAKKKSQEHSVTIASMDNPRIYGKTFYYLSFGNAVDHGILTDYKVQVLTIDENYLDKNMQDSIANKENGIRVNDIGKIIGTWNAMLKRKSFSNQTWGKPMQRAIAFAQVIDNQKGKRSAGKVGSKQIAREFNYVMQDYLGKDYDDSYHVDIRHVDGSMNAMQKENALDWLSKPVPENSAKILSNVKFLGEGVDVPSLDAVIFYAPKQSQIDIVQAVGRVMRKFPNKNYGYIILPIVIPYGKDPKEVLDRNKTYKSVWQVLNALRSIDERFDAEVNKLSLHNYRSERIMITGEGDKPSDSQKAQQLELPLWHSIYGAIKGEIVKHVGNRRYLDDWSNDVAKIAKRHINWINLKLKDKNSDFTKAFDKYLTSLRHNINDQISKRQAVEMIAQHIITKPVFNALFSNNDFVNNNPVSKAMEGITKQMKKAGFQKEQATLEPFYKSVQMRASGINDANDKQQFIKTLYNEFFSKSFSATTSRLGIVFTPVPIVNFIVHSVDYALHKYFGKSIASKGVNVLDPFVGTGTFITQTLYYLADLWKQHKIKLSDIVRNYTQELYCNEIVLLSYYIAAINIESVFNEIIHSKKYQEFKGIVLTDTFESTERDNVLDDGMFNGNNRRLQNEKKQPITVIISNPPYSKGHKSANDNTKTVDYPKLNNEIRMTYAKYSTSRNPSRIYNSYIKALRWCSDRIGTKGVIGFVTNAIFLTSRSSDGIRHCLDKEFNYVYIYNLKGNQRLAGEERRKGGAPVFNAINGTGGSKNPIAISILIKDGSNNHQIFYKDIGDYLSTNNKLNRLKKNKSIENIRWESIIPNKYNEWINQRDPQYQKYIPLKSKKGYAVFKYSALGIITSRDPWTYGFSKSSLVKNVCSFLRHYNIERIKFHSGKITNLIDNNKYIKWSHNLKNYCKRNISISYNENHIIFSAYRPFVKKWLYYDKSMVERPRLYRKKFGHNNIVIDITGGGANREFSALATRYIPDYGFIHNGQGFMMYDKQKQENTLISLSNNNINQHFANALNVSTKEAFNYIYGILNCPEYKIRYKNDLKDQMARIPILKNYRPFIDIGKELIKLHVNYEAVKPYTNLTIQYHSKNPKYTVRHMMHPSPQRKHLDTIKFNSDITIKDIPLKAYKYVVNGKPAIDWILDQYRIKKDKKSGIVDDPNKFSSDPKYIFNLLLKVINVSLKTVDLVNKLPKMQVVNFDWRKH